MSTLGDLIVEHGPYTPHEVQRGFKHLPLTDGTELNALRDELIGLRREAADRDRANELSDRIAAELRLATRERDALARRCAVRFEEVQALRAQLGWKHETTGPAQPPEAQDGPAVGQDTPEAQRGAEAVNVVVGICGPDGLCGLCVGEDRTGTDGCGGTFGLVIF